MPPTKPNEPPVNEEPPPQSFTFFLNNLAHGEAESTLSYEMSQLLKFLQEQARAHNGVVKGKLKLAIAIAMNEADAVAITYNVTTDRPRVKTTPATCWVNKFGQLTDKNPKQQGLFDRGLRDVGGGKKEFRTVDAPETSAPREV